MKTKPAIRSKRAVIPAPIDSVRPTGDFSVLEKVTELLQALGHHSSGLSQPAPHARTPETLRENLSARELTDALLDRLIRRIPRGGKGSQPGEVCPYTGLNRSAIYELMNKRDKSGPVIKTVTLREEAEKHGARFYYVGSLLRYLDQLAETQAEQDAKAKNANP